MKRVLLTIPAFLFVVGMFLAILLGLVRVTLMIGDIPSGILRLAAWCGLLALGSILLLGGTAVATRVAVWLFRPAAGIEPTAIRS
jgi:hypothetical protein